MKGSLLAFREGIPEGIPPRDPFAKTTGFTIGFTRFGAMQMGISRGEHVAFSFYSESLREVVRANLG